MDKEHSPTPWQVGHIKSAVGTTIWRNDGDEDNSGWERICRNVSTPENAEFIIRACNSHDLLIAALYAVQDEYRPTGTIADKIDAALIAAGVA